MCVRGLKLESQPFNWFINRVARRVRAWIETYVGLNLMLKLSVARRVRAWIET